MTVRSVVLISSVLIAAALLGCLPTNGQGQVEGTSLYQCYCTDPQGNKSYVLQDGPCDKTVGMTCTPIVAGTGGSTGTGGTGGTTGSGGSGGRR